MKLHNAYLLLTCFAASPVLAQTSVMVAADNLNSGARTDSSAIRPTDHPVDRRIARGPRTDDTSNCNIRGLGNGSSGASGGAGASASAPRTGYFGCEAAQNRDRK